MVIAKTAAAWIAPTRFDLWFDSALAHHLGRHPLFDSEVQSAVAHNVLGGLSYAAALFYFWVKGSGEGGDAMRNRMITIALGTVAAIGLMFLAAPLITWTPPSHYPGLAELYPRYLRGNPNASSFPSQSTTLYAALAAGIYSLNKLAGGLLWAGVLFLIALPRIYVGGHYPSDILAGLFLGITGYEVARRLFEDRWVPALAAQVFKSSAWRRVVGEMLIYLWILEAGNEFRDVLWAKYSLERILR